MKGLPVSVAVSHPRQGVTVRVDADIWQMWTARDLPTLWIWSPERPTYRIGGGERSVIDTILGRPGKLGSNGPFDLTMGNLLPLGGTEADASGLTQGAEAQESAVLALEVNTYAEPADEKPVEWSPPVKTTSETLPDGTVISTHS